MPIASQRRLVLPKQLPRPIFRPISPAAIAAVTPELSEVPIEYIQQQLHAVGEQMYTTTTKITAQCPGGRLPRELEVVINDISSEAPTHVFATYSAPSVFQKQRVTLHPVHALVFASQCAHLPHLHVPPSSSVEGANTITLPILPLRLPSPRTFTLLLAYLYTHRTHDILSALLPIPPNVSSPPEISQKLADTCTLPALVALAQTTHELWSNVAALGIFDDALWRAIDDVWAALLGALALKSGASSSPLSPL
ncbi:hypothetical protein K439DRAFT_1345767 [Ramaria rubella]|nr:hypothetical protein K439DRAFT_1345767 [Ramaria rubella]